MDITFIIRFSPEAKIDYNYDLIVETEREKYIVPIITIGKRAMINFPVFLIFKIVVSLWYIIQKFKLVRPLLFGKQLVLLFLFK